MNSVPTASQIVRHNYVEGAHSMGIEKPENPDGRYSCEQLNSLLDRKINVTTALGTGHGTIRHVDDEAMTITLDWVWGDMESIVRIEEIQEIKLYEAG